MEPAIEKAFLYFVGPVLLGDAELFPDAFGKTAGNNKGEEGAAEKE
jgi:hypothetical protein